MVAKWSKTLAANVYRVYMHNNSQTDIQRHGFTCRYISRVATVDVPLFTGSTGKNYAAKSEGQDLEQLVNLSKMFRSKPNSLALPPGSPQRINKPNYQGIQQFILRLMLFYSKQSTCIRAANVIYRRVVSQVDKQSVYDVLRLEKTFRTTFSMLVVHMWLCLRRLKVEGKEGVELGQYVYEIYNHDLEIRVSKAGNAG